MTKEEIPTERETELTEPCEKKEKRGIFKIVPVWSFVFFMIALAAVCIHVALYLSPSFADAFNGTVSAGIRPVCTA